VPTSPNWRSTPGRRAGVFSRKEPVHSHPAGQIVPATGGHSTRWGSLLVPPVTRGCLVAHLSELHGDANPPALAELLLDVLHVAIDRPLADLQYLSNFGICVAFDDEACHLGLPPGEPIGIGVVEPAILTRGIGHQPGAEI